MVAEAVSRWADAGANTVVLQPIPDEPTAKAPSAPVAQQVRPLVS